jgi:hypothetical protein
MPATIQTLTRRVEALEARLTDLEGGSGRTLHRLHRDMVGIELSLGKVANYLGLTAPTDDEVDAVLHGRASVRPAPGA